MCLVSDGSLCAVTGNIPASQAILPEASLWAVEGPVDCPTELTEGFRAGPFKEGEIKR
jgi:hypothetical protein